MIKMNISIQKLHDAVVTIMKKKDLKDARIFLIIDKNRIEFKYFGKDFKGLSLPLPENVQYKEITHCFNHYSKMLIVNEIMKVIEELSH